MKEVPEFNKGAFCCPICDAYAHQTWLILSERSTTLNHVSFFDGINNAERNYAAMVDLENVHASKCAQCKENSYWLNEILIYPNRSLVDIASDDMPVDIRKDYNEARSVFSNSPKASAALLRLCVEKLCIHLGAKDGNLNEKIGFLVQKGLSNRTQKALDIVRVIGNEAVHPGQINLDDNKKIAQALFKLVNQIVFELVTEEKEIDEIYDLLPEGKKAGIEMRDQKKSG